MTKCPSSGHLCCAPQQLDPRPWCLVGVFVTKTILNQCNSVFAMRTFDDTGKEFLANYLGRSYADVLPNLSERHAIFLAAHLSAKILC